MAVVANCHDLGREPAVVLRGGGFHMAGGGERVLAFARYLIAGGNVLRRLAHGDVCLGHALGEVGMRYRIETGHGHPCHRFDSGADKGLARVHLDCAGGDVDGIHRRTAETVNCGTGDRNRQVGEETDQARDVEALFALRESASHDQVFDVGRIDAGPLQQTADNLGGHLVGAHLGERALVREVERRACVPGDVYILVHGQQFPRRGGEGILRFQHARAWTDNG